MVDYLKGHEWFLKEYGVYCDVVGDRPILFGPDHTNECPICGYSPAGLIMGMGDGRYSRLVCNNSECKAEFALYWPKDDVYPLSHIRTRQSMFGRPIQNCQLLHRKGKLWHLPLMGYQPVRYSDNHYDLMIEIWLDGNQLRDKSRSIP